MTELEQTNVRRLVTAYSAFMEANKAENASDRRLWGWMLAKAQIRTGIEMIEPRLLGEWGKREYEVLDNFPSDASERREEARQMGFEG